MSDDPIIWNSKVTDVEGYSLEPNLSIEYPHVDFVQALDIAEQGKDFFLTKDISGEFVLFSDEPTSKHFFRMFEGPL